MYFLSFFLHIAPADLNMLFILLQPALECLGEVVFADCPDDLFSLRIEFAEGQGHVASFFYSIKNKKSTSAKSKEPRKFRKTWTEFLARNACTVCAVYICALSLLRIHSPGPS